jgi:hypothetical protein
MSLKRFAIAPLFLSLGAWTAGPAFAQNFVAVADSANPIITANHTQAYAGAAWVDVDEDGLLDLFVSGRGAIMHNLGGGDFEQLGMRIPVQGSPLATTWSDYDNDGDIDVFLSGSVFLQNGSNLYRNDGELTFTKVTEEAIGAPSFYTGWGAAFGDIDNDSFTDIVVAAANNFGGVTHVNRLLMNDGDGTFTNVDSTVVTAVLDAYTVPTWSDYDDDGDIDLFIGSGEISQLDEDNLYRNTLTENGVWGFELITTAPIATDLVDGQVWNWIDYDNDGDLDAYQTNYGNGIPNNLYRNDGPDTYTKMTPGDVGTIASQLGAFLSNVWEDFDNDGDLDCFGTTDGVGLDYYWVNNGDGTFTADAATIVANTGGPHYGATVADYDADGDLDMYVSGLTATKRLYRNDLANGNHSINLKLVGGGVGYSNVSAIGAKVKAKATIGGTPTWMRRDVSAQDSFNSMSMLNVHFGLGDATVIDSLVVEWPSGQVDVMTGVAADQFLTIQEVDVTGVTAIASSGPAGRLAQNSPNPFATSTSIGFEIPRKGEVALRVFDAAGRLVRTLADGVREPGAHRVEWDGRDASGRTVASGVYLYRLETAEGSEARKAVRLD